MKLSDPPMEPVPTIASMPPVRPLSEPPVDPLKQLRVLFRYRWQILRTALLVFVLGLLGVFLVTKTYRGTATVLIEGAGANVVGIQEVYKPGIPGVNLTEYQNTQIEVLKSRMIAERVFTELKLEQFEEYNDQDKTTGLMADIKALLVPSSATPEGSHAAAVDRMMRNIRVESVIRSNLVKVSAESTDAELSARIANAIVTAYVQFDRQARGGLASEASGWLQQRLTEIKADLEHSEKSLQKFYESEQLVNVGGARGMVEDEINDNARRVREARTTKTDLENVYRRIVSAGNSIDVLQEIPQVQQEPLVQTTKRLFLEAQSEVGGLNSRYGPKHPKMISARARLADAKQALRTQVLLAAEGIRSQYEVARNTESSLSSIVEDSRSQIQGLDRKQNELEILQRDVNSNRKLYDTLQERSKETDIAGNLDIGKVRVIEEALAPKKPYKPRKALWLATALVLGLFLGISTALVRSLLDDTVKTPNDLERTAQIPALTVLPLVRESQNLDRLEIEDPQSTFSEGVRTLRTSLLLADFSRKRRRVLITSAVPGEGKTSVALNLAIALGQVERVLLIDADLRKPSIATRIKLPPDSKGIVELITGTAERSQCVLRHPSGLIDVLTCMRPPPNPLELVSSERFSELLNRLSADYDRVIIDSPPCQPVSDSLLLSRCADAVIFLVKADSTPSRVVNISIKALQHAGAPLIGAVLNQADTRRQSGFSYGYYYYQGGYGSYKATSS